MAIMQLKDGRWVVRYRKGTIPEDPDRTSEYFGRGLAGRQAAEQRNRDLGFGRRKPQEKKTSPPLATSPPSTRKPNSLATPIPPDPADTTN
jgi:hypothetical protein